jgi:UrcA family protein
MRTRAHVLHACLALLAASPVVAEPDTQTNSVEDESGWLTVHAPRVFRLPVDRRAGGTNNELVAISHRVSYAGLDLDMHADVLELRRRIVESATTGCEQLAALSPLADLDTATCKRESIDDAMVRAQKVVADAMAARNAK